MKSDVSSVDLGGQLTTAKEKMTLGQFYITRKHTLTSVETSTLTEASAARFHIKFISSLVSSKVDIQ